jgi:hypothetical protein
MWQQSVQQMLLFSPRLPSPLLSSPRLSFVLPMMILFNPLHDMDYDLMINTCEELGIIPSCPYYISSLSLL